MTLKIGAISISYYDAGYLAHLILMSIALAKETQSCPYREMIASPIFSGQCTVHTDTIFHLQLNVAILHQSQPKISRCLFFSLFFTIVDLINDYDDNGEDVRCCLGNQN